MKKIEIEEKNLEAAYAVASEETKKVLDALFGRKPEENRKPTLDDYTTIRTYEDACEALGESCIIGGECIKRIWSDSESRSKLSSHILALMKLETISRALLGWTWEPTTEFLKENICYSPIFKFEDGKLSFLFYSPIVVSYNNSQWIDMPIQLCQETDEKAEYFGRQFIDLWAEYLGFDSKVSEEDKQ